MSITALPDKGAFGDRTSSETRLLVIDRLRGMAAISIVLFHVREYMWVGLREFSHGPRQYMHSTLDKIIASFFIPTHVMGSAIMLFFILSGFSIHYSYAGRTRQMNVKTYGIRRFFRIYPTYLAAILFTVLVEQFVNSLALGGDGWTSTPARVILSTSLMCQSYVSPFHQFNANGAFWTLPIEVEFYLIFPILYKFWRTTSNAAAGLVTLCLSGLVGAMYSIFHWSWIPDNFAIYWVIWMSGALLAELFRTDRLPRWHGAYYFPMLLCFAMATVQVYKNPHYTTVFTEYLWAIAYFFVLLKVLTAHRPSPGPRVREPVFTSLIARILDFLGLISFSLYLTHLTLMYLFLALWQKQFATKPDNPVWPLLATVVAVGFAYVFYLCFEAPAHRYGKSLAARFR